MHILSFRFAAQSHLEIMLKSGVRDSYYVLLPFSIGRKKHLDKKKKSTTFPTAGTTSSASLHMSTKAADSRRSRGGGSSASK